MWRIFLCRVGYHYWQLTYSLRYSSATGFGSERLINVCKHCGKEDQ